MSRCVLSTRATFALRRSVHCVHPYDSNTNKYRVSQFHCLHNGNVMSERSSVRTVCTRNRGPAGGRSSATIAVIIPEITRHVRSNLVLQSTVKVAGQNFSHIAQMYRMFYMKLKHNFTDPLKTTYGTKYRYTDETDLGSLKLLALLPLLPLLLL
jgi:hypothetical protein